MHVYIDADACPVIKQVEEIAAQYDILVTLLCDTNHVLRSNYSEVQVVSSGADAVDLALINLCRPGDIVVTQDYGVAALALGKGAYAIHQNGWRYTQENIDGLLMERHLAKKLVGRTIKYISGDRKSGRLWRIINSLQDFRGCCDV